MAARNGTCFPDHELIAVLDLRQHVAAKHVVCQVLQEVRAKVVNRLKRVRTGALRAGGVLCPHVFHRDGKPVSSFSRAWKSACRLAGVPGTLFHDLRRTAARNLIRAGVNEKLAMEILGHKTPAIFARYNITTEDDMRDALGAVAARTRAF